MLVEEEKSGPVRPECHTYHASVTAITSDFRNKFRLRKLDRKVNLRTLTLCLELLALWIESGARKLPNLKL